MKPVTPINVDCIPEKEYLSPEFQLSVSSKSDGLFIYETSDPAVFTVNQDGIVTITGPGSAYVIISQLESENFAANEIDRSIVVNKSKPPISFSGPETLLLGNTPLSARLLKIETITELIRSVFSTDETVLKIRQILPNEYELVPVSIGEASVIISTRSNYYFNSTSARFDIEVLETLQYQPLIININTFTEQFQHNALKDIDILTSNTILEPKNNNLQIAVQQQTRGYNYDVGVLNLAADKFINSINNYNKEILCCTETGFLQFSVQWNFGNNTVYDFFPYNGNINDRPRINLFRSDGKYIDYVSGGFNFLKIPQNSGPENPNAYVYQKWGNRNIGIKQFRVPDIKCLVESGQTFASFDPSARANFWDFTQDSNNKRLSGFRIAYTNGSITADWGDGVQSGINSNINYSHTFKTSGLQLPLPSLYYGVDLFTTEDLPPTILNPPSGQWKITNTGPDEIKYQYLFTGNYEKNIVVQLPPFVAPNVPAGLMASNITVNGMTISWTANPRAVSYRLDVSTASDFATRLAGYDNLVVNGTSQSVTGLISSTIYYVRVRAVNAAGTSPNSATLTQITVPVAPNQPTITNVTSATFTASWNSVAGASEYRVDVATSNNFTSGFVTGYNDQVVNGTSVSVIGLTGGTIYYVRVRARNTLTANIVTSTPSPSAEQVTLVGGPTNLTATAITTTSFTANWNSVTGASSYRLDVSTVSNFATLLEGYNDLTVNGTNQQIIGLTAGTIYYVRVRAVNSAGIISPNSVTLTQITVPVAPNQPTISNVTSVTFIASWNAVVGASSYRIDVATSDDFTSGFVTGYNNRTVTGATNVSAIGLSPGTTYYVRVRAFNDQTANSVTSANSPNAAQITALLAPTASVITTTGFTANWASVIGATYRLDVSTVSNFATRLTGYDDLTVNGTSQQITGLTAGTIYYVRVRAVNAAGTSPNSTTLTQITVPVAPNQPAISNVTSVAFTASWNSVAGASEYRVDVATSDNFTSGFVQGYQDGLVSGGATSVNVTGLLPGRTYFIRVRARNTLTANIVTSAPSPNAQQLTSVPAPSIVTTLSSYSIIEEPEQYVTLQWTQPNLNLLDNINLYVTNLETNQVETYSVPLVSAGGNPPTINYTASLPELAPYSVYANAVANLNTATGVSNTFSNNLGYKFVQNLDRLLPNPFWYPRTYTNISYDMDESGKFLVNTFGNYRESDPGIGFQHGYKYSGTSTGFNLFQSPNVVSLALWEGFGYASQVASMSSNGEVFAIGFPNANSVLSVNPTGSVVIFKTNSTSNSNRQSISPGSEIFNNGAGNTAQARGLGFGGSIAINDDGTLVAIGAPNHNNHQGLVALYTGSPDTFYTYCRSIRLYSDFNYNNQGTPPADSSTLTKRFGSSLSLRGTGCSDNIKNMVLVVYSNVYAGSNPTQDASTTRHGFHIFSGNPLSSYSRNIELIGERTETVTSTCRGLGGGVFRSIELSKSKNVIVGIGSKCSNTNAFVYYKNQQNAWEELMLPRNITPSINTSSFREPTGILNGIRVNHDGSLIMVNGLPVIFYSGSNNSWKQFHMIRFNYRDPFSAGPDPLGGAGQPGELDGLFGQKNNAITNNGNLITFANHKDFNSNSETVPSTGFRITVYSGNFNFGNS